MNSVTQKVEKLRSIASSLGLQGESVEAIIQMLGYALHTSEVEHVAYTQEASLERATEVNSKIQHCVNMMYSVYRGQNPRVIMTFSPQKRFTFNPGDLVAKASTFSAYYLGYWDEESSEFIESGITLYPGGESYFKTIICVISQYEVQDTWKISSDNLFYHTVQKSRDRQFAKLSSDYTLFISDTQEGEYTQLKTTRRFSEHERLNYFMDLTLPGFGVNIYYPRIYEDLVNRRSEYSDKWIKIKIHETLNLDDINPGDLGGLMISGSIPVATPEDVIKSFETTDTRSINSSGLIYIKESGYDSMESIHYLANKNRYSGSYLATNSDLSFLLSESFPNKIRQTDGVICRFDEGVNDIVLYYIPTNASLEITNSEKNRFIGEQGAYYVTKNIDIRRATRYNAKITLNLDLYAINNLNDEIDSLLQKYQYKFGVDLGNPENQTPDYLEIKSLVSKIDEVKYISGMDITYTDINGEEIKYEDLSGATDKDFVSYDSRYLTFLMVDGGNISWDGYGDLQYSTNNGLSWSTLTNRTSTPQFNAGTEVLVKSDMQVNGEIGRFEVSGTFDVYGNIMSLLYLDSYKDKTSLKDDEDGTTFESLFEDCKTLRNAENLVLPAITLSPRCYYSMFDSCSNLISVPKLPAIILEEDCYSEMFCGCSSLKKVPDLPAKYLAPGCYWGMFEDCTSIVSGPALPATDLKDNCYNGMFWGCTSLVAAPSLPSKVMAYSCYKNMFNSCTSLVNAPALPSMNLEASCYHGMFEGCTSITLAPELPATTIKKSCYSHMFSDCTSLKKAPVLPSENLMSGCYEYMFSNCSSLSYIKAMFIDTNYSATSNWVTGVSKSGVFIKNIYTSWDIDEYEFGNSMIPMDWECRSESYSASESEYKETGTITSSSSSSESISTSGKSSKSQVKPYYHVITCEINSTMS